MKKNWIWKIALLVVGGVLAACAGTDASLESEQNNQSADLLGPPLQISMIVGPQLVDCVGEGPQECLQVKIDPQEDWQLFYSPIEGFDYQPGYRYTLLVEQLDVQDPPAGGSSLRYVLVDVLEKVEELQVDAAELAGTHWVLTGFGSLDQPQGVLEKVIVSLMYDPEQGRISGSAGCNNYFGEVNVDGDQLTFSTGPMGMTRMACSDQIMQQEAGFLKLLGSVTRFAIQEGSLFLFTETGDVLTFEPGEQPAGRQ